MQKKLLAVAVAGVLAAPAVALAQSSVTISGVFKSSLENVKIDNRSAAAAGMNNSATRLADDSSRIIFNVTEDLGGGLAAIGQLDVRFRYDESGAGTATNVGGAIGSGNSFVGLRSKSWGELVFGRRDLHYFNTESTFTTKATSLRMDSISLLAYINGSAIANATRTQNVVRWLSPNWGGFTMIAAYSTNSPGNDNDLASNVRKGDAFNFNPNFQASNWQLGYSYWKQTSDGVATATPAALTASGCAGGGAITFTGLAVTANTCATPVTITGTLASTSTAAQNQRGDRLYGSFKWSGFQIGLAWDKSKVKAVTNTAAGSTTLETGNRTAWSLPASYTMGNHNFYAHYTEAGDNKSVAGSDKAKMWALGYVYDMSKRTSLGVSYSKITNETGASYNHFTSTSLGGPDSAVAAGEDPSIWAATIRHAF